MDIGATLRDAREKRGLSLESLACRTKIRIDLLQAIEVNAFERLPAGVFTRGFLRAYAREVGLDSEQIVSQYQTTLVKNDAAATIATDTGTAAAGLESSPSVEARPPARPLRVSLQPWLIAAVLVAALVVSLFVLPALWRSPASPSTLSAEATAPAPAPPPPTPVATAGKPIRVDIQVQRPCWVSATADGQRVVFKTMQSGEHQTITVLNELRLRVGDAAALSFSIDGATGRSVGGPGQPVTVRLTPENYREFLVNDKR